MGTWLSKLFISRKPVSIFTATDSPSASEETPDLELPDGVLKLNDSVFQFYTPTGRPAFDILFFHGLQPSDNYGKACWSTWSSDGKIWPKTLLSERFPQARILSVSYDSCARGNNRNDLDNIANILLRNIIEHDRVAVGRDRPVILVGHSLGGLVIKKLILFANGRLSIYDPNLLGTEIKIIKTFLKNLSGIFYYGTPHGGSELANLVTKIPGSSPVLHLLKTLSKETERLNEQFREWRQKNGKLAATMFELLPTTKYWGMISAVIVTEASAIRDSDLHYPAQKDHIQICKAKDTKDGTSYNLEQFITRTTDTDCLT